MCFIVLCFDNFVDVYFRLEFILLNFLDMFWLRGLEYLYKKGLFLEGYFGEILLVCMILVIFLGFLDEIFNLLNCFVSCVVELVFLCLKELDLNIGFIYVFLEKFVKLLLLFFLLFVCWNKFLEGVLVSYRGRF